MKGIESLFAQDKLAHFAWGAMICSIITIITMLQDIDGPLGWHQILYCLIGTAVVLVADLAKEFVIDAKADMLDFWMTLLGCVPVWIAVALGILFNILMHSAYGDLLAA